MEVWLQRRGDALIPDSVESAAEFARLPFGKSLHCEIKQPRNLQMHRLYFALCHRIAQAKGMNAENISDLFKIGTGHAEIITTRKYGEIRLPKSIAFARFDQTGFRDFFNRCVQVAYEEWQIDPAAVADLLAPTEDYRAEKTA